MAAAATAPSDSLPEAEFSRLAGRWDEIKKPLLKLGAKGAKPSHLKSLVELLDSHEVVKVQVNGCGTEAATAIGEELSEASGAVLLLVKGSTLMFHMPGSRGAEKEAQRISARKAKNDAFFEAKKERKADDADP